MDITPELTIDITPELEPPASLCDTCSNPGSCCRGFMISSHWFPVDGWEELAKDFLHKNGVPFFQPIKAVTIDKSRCKVACDCTLLDENGRCSDYENRPAVCRNYEPASDQLCCEWKGEREPAIPEEFLVCPKDSK